MQKKKDRAEKYIIICDESSKYGNNYSYFYGGAMIKESEYEKTSQILESYKSQFGLHELKRTKITKANYKQYIDILEFFFVFVKAGKIKIRIMFSPNYELIKFDRHSQNESFIKLYHTFIINAFNIFYARKPINIRLIFDDLPETKSKNQLFKKLLKSKIVNNTKIDTNKVYTSDDRMEEVDSKKHIILQCVDVIVGLTDFILNTSNDDIKKSERAKARYEVWKCIESNILAINPNFELTRTTQPVYSHKAWQSSYRHFVYRQKKQ